MVVSPTVHTACNTAWITDTNIGSLTDPAGKKGTPEMAGIGLQKEHGRWLIRFFESAVTPGSQKRLRTFLTPPGLPAPHSGPQR
jgi:hypothetical protein